jgi:menaquinone-dependent protoporphyrinogen oxidase
MASVLVAYASKYGSTREVAEAIVAALQEQGVDAVAQPAGEVESLDGHSAVVLGTALFFFRWRREAHRFLSRNRAALANVPVAVFALGPIEDKPEQYVSARGHLDKGLAKHPWLSPVSVAVFGGRVDPTHLRFPESNPGTRRMPPVDLRDWEAIDTWARELVDALGIRADSETAD